MRLFVQQIRLHPCRHFFIGDGSSGSGRELEAAAVAAGMGANARPNVSSLYGYHNSTAPVGVCLWQ